MQRNTLKKSILSLTLGLGSIVGSASTTLAETITFKFTGATIDNQTITLGQANGHWITLAGYEVKFMLDGNKSGDDVVGVFWTRNLPYSGPDRAIQVTISGRVCVDESCGDITLGSNMTLSSSGLSWNPIPPAFTYLGQDGSLIGLTPFIFVRADGTDLEIKGRLLGGVLPNSPVPEPMTLSLLGLGLLGLAGRMRKKPVGK